MHDQYGSLQALILLVNLLTEHCGQYLVWGILDAKALLMWIPCTHPRENLWPRSWVTIPAHPVSLRRESLCTNHCCWYRNSSLAFWPDSEVIHAGSLWPYSRPSEVRDG